MNMVISSQFQKDTLNTLGILYKNFLIQKKQNIEVFLGDFRTGIIDPETFFDTVLSLKDQGFTINEYDRDATLSEEQRMGARNTPCCEVQLPEDFQRVYTKLSIQYGGQIEQDKVSRQTTKIDKIILHLNSVGDLWREPKSKYCYEMGEKSGRHKIVRYLSQNHGYQQTSAISQEINGKNEQVIRTEIQKINSNVKNHLGKKIGRLIEGRKDSGYRIVHSVKPTNQ